MGLMKSRCQIELRKLSNTQHPEEGLHRSKWS